MLFGQLEKDPGCRLGVDKGNPAPAGTAARVLVHQLVAMTTAGLEGALQIRHPVADVVNTGPPFGEKLGDGAVRIARGEQLDVYVGEGDGNYLGAVGCFGFGRRKAEDVTVEGGRFFEIGDGDANVRHPGRYVVHIASHGRSRE